MPTEGTPRLWFEVDTGRDPIAGLSGLALAPRGFRAAGSGPSVIAAAVGGRVSYTLSEAARVKFRVKRRLPGRRVRGRCVRPRRSNRSRRRCTRYVTLRGSFSDQGQPGSNALTFSGRLGGCKLRPGRYRLRAVATDPSGNQSAPTQASFRIVR